MEGISDVLEVLIALTVRDMAKVSTALYMYIANVLLRTDVQRAQCGIVAPDHGVRCAV
jgi:hypothetical protein